MESQLSKSQVGAQGEARAELWFLENFPKARLVEKNFRCRAGEIDLIFEESLETGTELVFVEVRVRTQGSAWETGLESLRFSKQRRLRRAIQWYLAQYPGVAQTLRVDALAWDGSLWVHTPNLWNLGG